MELTDTNLCAKSETQIIGPVNDEDKGMAESEETNLVLKHNYIVPPSLSHHQTLDTGPCAGRSLLISQQLLTVIKKLTTKHY